MEHPRKFLFSSMLLAACLVSALVSAAQPLSTPHAEDTTSHDTKHAGGSALPAAPVAKTGAKPHAISKSAHRAPIPTFIAAIVSSTDFCFFLPPDPKAQTVAEAEDRAVAYCTKDGIPGTTGAKVFPPNFIVASHFQQNEAAGWIQVTGLINPTVYGMSMADDGGQYDVKAPVGASCVGYSSFVNLIEPSSSRFCMRCCQKETDCNVKISEYGCERIVPGDYKLGGDVTSHLMYPESIGMTASQVEAAEAALGQGKGKAVPPTAVGDGAVTAASAGDGQGGSSVDWNKSSLNANSPASMVSAAAAAAAAIRGVQWQTVVMISSLVALSVGLVG